MVGDLFFRSLYCSPFCPLCNVQCCSSEFYDFMFW